MIFEFVNYRQFLKAVAAERASKNPAYSLRAMASQVGLAPSTFSEVINGKKNISVETASNIASRLGLDTKENEYFCVLVQLESSRDPHFRNTLEQKLKQLNSRRPVHILNVDLFKVIAEWYHLAILGTLTLDSFDFSPSHLAKHFGITKLEAQTAIERLERLELIEKDTKGRYHRVTNDLLVSSAVSNKSLNHYHKQMLIKAADSIEGQPIKERIIRTENIAIDDDQVAAADALVEDFFAKMSKLTSKAKKKSQLYHLSTQFFNLRKSGGSLS